LLVKTAPTDFPLATLGVNILGSLLMGLLMGWLSRQSAAQESLRLLLGVGLLGGFTTFSAFSMELFHLLDKREILAATSYLGGSVLGGCVAFILGYMLVRAG
jgi:CrcB protein